MRSAKLDPLGRGGGVTRSARERRASVVDEPPDALDIGRQRPAAEVGQLVVATL
jgi:hypothetical protein